MHVALSNWASSRENLSSEVCEQQKRRPACASAQSDQRLCYSRFGKNHILACYRRNFNFLASLCSCGDWFECGYVRNPEDRFSHDEAPIIPVGVLSHLCCCIRCLKDCTALFLSFSFSFNSSTATFKLSWLSLLWNVSSSEKTKEEFE